MNKWGIIFNFQPSYELRMKILTISINGIWSDVHKYGKFVLFFEKDEKDILLEVIEWSKFRWHTISSEYKRDIKPFKGLYPIRKAYFEFTDGKCQVRFSYDFYDNTEKSWKDWFIMEE